MTADPSRTPRLPRGSGLALGLALAGIACHAAPTQAPEQPKAGAAQSPAQIQAQIEASEVLSDAACATHDAALRAHVGGEQELEAQYVRAELALRCDDPMLWQALHEKLIDLGHGPSLTRMAEYAAEQENWALLDRLANMGERSFGGPVVATWRHEAARARWIDYADEDAFAQLEREAKQAILREPTDLDARAALIQLYVEYAGLGPVDPHGEKPEALLLAQLTEREARKVAEDLGTRSAKLEFVAGFIRELEGQREAAVAAWEQAAQINAAFDQPHLWLGLAAMERRDFAEATRQLERYVASFPDHAEAHLALAVASAAARRVARRSEEGKASEEPPAPPEPAAPPTTPPE